MGITADLGANFLLQENGVIFGLKTEQLKAIIVPVHMCAGLSDSNKSNRAWIFLIS